MRNKEEMKEILNNMVARSIIELHDQLYPKGLGKTIEAHKPELRLVIIAKFEGRAEVLDELGADIRNLENKINEEAEKTAKGQY